MPRTYEAYAEMASAYEEAGGLPIEQLQEMGILILGTPQRRDRAHRGGPRRLRHQPHQLLVAHRRPRARKVRESMELFAREVMPKFVDPAPFPAEILEAAAAPASV